PREMSRIARHQDRLMLAGKRGEQEVEIRDRLSSTVMLSPEKGCGAPIFEIQITGQPGLDETAVKTDQAMGSLELQIPSQLMMSDRGQEEAVVLVRRLLEASYGRLSSLQDVVQSVCIEEKVPHGSSTRLLKLNGC